MKNLLQGDSISDPPNQLEVKVDCSIHWTTPMSADKLSVKDVFIPSL